MPLKNQRKGDIIMIISKHLLSVIALLSAAILVFGGVDDNYYKLSDYSGSLSNALTAIGTNEAKLLIDTDCTISSDQTVPRNVTLRFVRGKVFSINYARKLYINGTVEAGAWQIFAGSGYVNGNIKNKSVFPQWWGAIADDANDDQPAIQQALYYLRFGEGGELYFPKGTYLIESELIIESCSEITLKGEKNAVLYLANNVNQTLFYGRYLQNVTIENLTFDGNRDNQTQGSWPHGICGAVLISQSKHVRIQNCNFKNFYYGITASGDNTRDVIFNNNYFYNNDSDIDTYGHGYVITNNIVENCTGASIQMEPSPGVASFDESKPDDADWTDSNLLSLENVISCNTIRGAQYGIVIHSGVCGIIISNNTIANVVRSGIKAYHDDIKDLVINSNTIRNITGVDSNLPWDTCGVGILLAEPLNGVISNNIVEYANTGIYMIHGNRTVIEGNICSFNRTSGICIYGVAGGSILNNLLYNNHTNAGTANAWWANSGILVHSSEDVTIDQNRTIDDNGDQRNCVHIYNASTSCSNIHLGRNFAAGTSQSAVEPQTSSAYSEDCPASTGVNFVTKMKHKGKVRDVGTAAPSSGTWNRGDIVWNSSPASGSNIGWVCVSSGAPGTWKSFGIIN